MSDPGTADFGATRRLADADSGVGVLSGKEVGIALIVATATVGILALRVPLAIHQFWAEDGSIFYNDALTSSAFRPFIRPYHGYYLLIPRFIGFVSTLVPMRDAATATWVMVAIVVAWCAVTVFLSAKPWIRGYLTRTTLVLGLAMLPSLGGESIASASNLQFTLLFPSIVVLVGTSRQRSLRMNGIAMLLLTSLTTPLAVVLAPLAVWRLIRSRRPRPDGETIAWAVGTAVQLIAIAVGNADRPTVTARNAGQLFGDVVQRIIYGNFSPFHMGLRVGPALAAVALILVAGVLSAAVVSWQRGARERAFLLIAVPCSGILLYIVSDIQGLAVGTQAHRYEMVPAWCLTWATLVAVESIRPHVPLRSRRTRTKVETHVRFASGTICLLLLIAWIPHWTPDLARRAGPTWQKELDISSRKCATRKSDWAIVGILPITHPPIWYVKIPCTQLR